MYIVHTSIESKVECYLCQIKNNFIIPGKHNLELGDLRAASKLIKLV